jgi:hypothetical protein
MPNHKLSKNVNVEKKLLGSSVDHNFTNKLYRSNIHTVMMINSKTLLILHL